MQAKINIVKSAILSATEKVKRASVLNWAIFSKETKIISLIPKAFGVIESNKLEIAIKEYILDKNEKNLTFANLLINGNHHQSPDIVRDKMPSFVAASGVSPFLEKISFFESKWLKVLKLPPGYCPNSQSDSGETKWNEADRKNKIGLVLSWAFCGFMLCVGWRVDGGC